MKKFMTMVLAMVMALSLAACGSKDETKKLTGTWQYRVDMSDMMNQQMAESLELGDTQLDGTFGIYLSLTVAEDGAYTMVLDTEATGDEMSAYLQTLTPVVVDSMYAAAEAEGMSREEFDAALTEMGMTAEEYVGAIFSAFDMGSLMSSMIGTEDSGIDAGYCKAEDGKLYLADTAEGLAEAGYVNYTFNGDGTMSWTDSEGELSGKLTAEEQELIQFPMVWTKQAA